MYSFQDTPSSAPQGSAVLGLMISPSQLTGVQKCFNCGGEGHRVADCKEVYNYCIIDFL